MKPVSYERIQYLLNLDPEALVRIYSYQGQIAEEKANELGYWTGHLPEIQCDSPDFSTPYRYMRHSMAERIPDFSGDLPMWGWTKRPSTKPKVAVFSGTRNDLRITALIPRKRILFSDYDTWHYVLNNGYYATNEADYEAFMANWPHHESYGDDAYKAAWQAAIEPTWERIFRFEKPTTPDEIYWLGHTNTFTVQACIDRIYPHEIVNIRRFPS